MRAKRKKDGTRCELRGEQLVMHASDGWPTVGMMVDDIFEEAERVGVRPKSTASRDHNVSPEHLVYQLRAIGLLLKEQVRVADAARVVHAALQEDEGLLEAVDAAYQLGGAKAVRDLLLRGAAQGGG